MVEDHESTVMTAKTVLEQALAAFGTGDSERLRACFHPDVVVEQADSLPYGGTHQGYDSYLSMLATIAETFEMNVVEHTILDAGATAAMTMRMSLRSTATGRSMTTSVVEVYELEGGRIARASVFYQDTHEMLELISG